jgi:hypothetical protein
MSKLEWSEFRLGNHTATGSYDQLYVIHYEPGEFDPIHGGAWVLDIWFGYTCTRRAWVDPTLEGAKAHCECLEERERRKLEGCAQTVEGPVLNQQSGAPRGSLSLSEEVCNESSGIYAGLK